MNTEMIETEFTMDERRLNDPAAFLVASSHFNERQIEGLEGWFLERFGKAHMDVEHRFAPGVYLRTITMPKGSYIIGHKHNTHHANVVLTGTALVMMNGQIKVLKAGDVFNSDAGVRKLLFILEDCRWMTIHPTTITDIPELERTLVTHSEMYLRLMGEEQDSLVNETNPLR